MSYKSCVVLLTLLTGCLALPVQDEDMSIFFDHTDSASRIVGGSLAGPVPHMVAMTHGQNIRSFLCGGSIITVRHVLTAAHCIVAVSSSSSLGVTVGTNTWHSEDQTYGIAERHIHSGYSSMTIKNDIGMLVTGVPIVLSDAVQPIVLSRDFIPGGVAARVNGWGRTVTGGPISAQLLELEMTIVDGEQCMEDVDKRAAELNMRGVPPVDPNVEICAYRGINQGACNGDSGSALLRVDNKTQIGIVSWGLPCARGAPDMFVRISAYIDWIENITAK